MGASKFENAFIQQEENLLKATKFFLTFATAMIYPKYSKEMPPIQNV